MLEGNKTNFKNRQHKKEKLCIGRWYMNANSKTFLQMEIINIVYVNMYHWKRKTVTVVNRY